MSKIHYWLHDPVGSKHVGANSVTSVTAYVILYSYIQVHKLVQIKSKFQLLK